MKKKSFLPLLFIILVLGTIAAIYFNVIKVGHSTTDNVNITQEVKLVELIHYYVPVVSFKDMRQDIALADLNKAQICTLQEDLLAVTKLLPEATVKVVDTAAVAAAIKEGAICLLPPEQVNFSYKTLKVDGAMFWAKETDLSKYTLQTKEELVETPEILVAKEKLAIYTSAEKRSRIFVGGEVIPARAVDRLALNKNNNYTYLFDDFREDISSADLAMAMLENDLKGDPTPCTGCMTFVGDEKNAAGFKTVGFDIFSLAGNHAGDGGQTGFETTIKAFDAQELLHTGTGKGDAAKIAPAVMEVNGRRVGVIAADTVAGYYWNKGTNSYGTNWFSKDPNKGIDMDRVKLIPKLKEENKIDYMVVFISWGIEYKNNPIQFQKDLAHAFIDNGVDLVLASHPHWAQSIEFYNDKPIFYSLGNFIFDQNHNDDTREAIVLNLYYVGAELKSISIIPHLTCGPFVSKVNLTDKYLSGEIDMQYLNSHDEKNGCVYFQPRKLTPDSKYYKEVYNRMLQYSNF